MLDFTLALVGAGPLPELSMREGALQLADRFSAELVPLACGSEPHSGLQALASRQRERNHPTLLRLSGDAAMAQGFSGSWFDALAASDLSLLRRDLFLLGRIMGKTFRIRRG